MKMFIATVSLVGAMVFGAVSGFAKTCELAIEGNDSMQFNKKELNVAADCTEVKLSLKHTGKLPKAAMGHNWVLSLETDKTGVIGDSMKAGLAKDYITSNDKRVIAHTKLIGGGESTDVTFKTSALKKGTSYAFYCTFPGHSAMMSGKLNFK